MRLVALHLALTTSVMLSVMAVAQNQTVNVVPRYAVRTPAQPIEPSIYKRMADEGKTLPIWGAFFQHNQKFYGFYMVGTDPTLGSATSKIKLVVIPLAVHFSDGTVLDPSKPVQCRGTDSPLTITQNSPMLQNVDWTQGGTKVGNTQYGDAFQRAEWWNFADGSAPDYHVLLKPVIEKEATMEVPADQGTTVSGHGCGVYGDVKGLFFDQRLREIMVQRKMQPNELPYFLTYDVVQDGGILGYHSTMASVIYGVGTFSDQNFGPHHAFQDMVSMSAVVGSIFNDPFGTNPTPNWKSSYKPSVGCHNLLETYEPLPGLAEPVKVPGNSHQYYVQDLAFELWFAKAPASTSVNGWFSMFGTFPDSSSNKDCK